MQLKACPSYLGYSVDENGDIYSNWRRGGGQYIKNQLCSKHRKLRGTINFHGYRVYKIKFGGKNPVIRAHVIILDAFIGPKPFPKAMGRHLDGVKLNNCPTNLVWGTRQQNADDSVRHGHIPQGERHHRAKLKDSTVLWMRKMYESGALIKELASTVGVTFNCAYMASSGKSWKHLKKVVS